MKPNSTRPAIGMPMGSGMFRLLFVVALIGLLPLVVDLGQRLWANEPYRFFPLAWGCGLLLWARRYGQTTPSARPRGIGVGVFLTVALILGAFSLLRWSPWAGGLAVVALLGAISWARAGRSSWRTLLPPLALVALSFPLPLGLDQVFMLQLKKVAVSVSSSLLDLLGIVHLRSGTVIELPQTQLMVEDACSGIQSFMAVAAFAALLFVLEERPWWHWLLLSVFASMVVIGMNVVRITAGAYVLVKHGWDILNGTPHLIFGAIIFAVELLLVFSFDRFLAFFEIAVQWTATGAVAGRSLRQRLGRQEDAGAAAGAVPTGRWGTVLVVLFAVFGVATGARGVMHFAQLKPRVDVVSYGPSDFPELAFTLPKELSGWSQGDTVPESRAIETIGLRSKIWVFSRGELRVFASIDYPFDHFHDLMNCYRTAGWEANQAGALPALTPGRPPIAYLNLARRGFDRTEVWYTSCFADGSWTGEAAKSGDAGNVSLWDRVVGKAQGLDPEVKGELEFRTQVCWTGLTPLLESDRRAIRELYEALSATLATQVKTQLAKTK